MFCDQKIEIKYIRDKKGQKTKKEKNLTKKEQKLKKKKHPQAVDQN